MHHSKIGRARSGILVKYLVRNNYLVLTHTAEDQ